MNTIDTKKVEELLSTPQKIAIIPHKNPDGDAIGSTLGLYHYLKLKGHEPIVVSPNDFPHFLKWLPEEDTIIKYDTNPKEGIKVIEEASLIFTLDFNDFSRVDVLKPFLEKATADFIMIDHHQSPSDFAVVTYSDTSMSSTCEMVYHFIDALGDIELVNSAIANCLYTGIMTDTGSFRFPSTTNITHRVVADLIEKGADNAKIHTAVYDTNSLSRLHLLGCALKNLTVLEDLNTVYITLSKKELNEFNFQKGDTEGFVNYGLSLNGIKFAVIFIENTNSDEDFVKISLRSKGDFDVNLFARAHFNGGGHKNAAGGRSDLTLEETVSYFEKTVATHKSQLSHT
ncbi:phosphoesterase RecJ domain-containing protein [Pustulibacterium marinum]|uniref:Phosphoesterase RecJ domain-containing protein n=1 Tax=Pustulibacterium marinum TaxID=1224947 RepID=A0A1I7G4Z8_9FLAO|nr:bifunctional oligoribonuclease/PAP phosphatase NrnA [Pustulibacterium marinum]SFU43519.1 phosphoesterase RecJ domain-containing protein [Pustulibacterium marinum]